MLFVFAGAAAADALTDAAQGLCDTIKTCALEQMTGQDMTEEVRQKMTPMLDDACADLRSQVQMVPTGHALYQPAVDCVRSMESLSCAQLQDAGRVTTPACNEYEELARKSGAASQ
jgi:hypothetical protein